MSCGVFRSLALVLVLLGQPVLGQSGAGSGAGAGGGAGGGIGAGGTGAGNSGSNNTGAASAGDTGAQGPNAEGIDPIAGADSTAGANEDTLDGDRAAAQSTYPSNPPGGTVESGESDRSSGVDRATSNDVAPIPNDTRNATSNPNRSTGGAATRRDDAATATNSNRWRYRRHNDEWWYWSPSERWLYWRDNQWSPYDAQTYRPLNRRSMDERYGQRDERNREIEQPYRNDGGYVQPMPRRYYSGYRGVGRPYDSAPYDRGYYNGGYYNGRYYNGGYRSGGYGYRGAPSYYYNRGGRVGAGIGGAIGGAIGGNRGAAIGQDLGGTLGSDR